MMLKGLLAALLISMASLVLAGSGPAKMDAQVYWRLTLDADGNVTTLEPTLTKASIALRNVLESAIRNWKFTPGMVNDAPAATETTLRVDFSLVPSADGNTYSIEFNYVQTGGAPGDNNYPPAMTWSQGQTLRSSGRDSELVVLLATYGVDGKVSAVELTDGSTVRKGSLVTLATETLRKWTFIPERVAGNGIAGRVIVPFCFTGKSVGTEVSCKWTSPNYDAEILQGQGLAMDSKVRLLTDLNPKSP